MFKAIIFDLGGVLFTKVPAKEMGITTILFISPEQLRQDLKKLGVL